ncbi:preprotein translocase subunit SecG [Marinimicrobium sp. ABcell2]|uniref:preprotein translocase subunit SecG n=1 Tax=Marinimicrobium sp. ABcell2 TaxID=3069751 RepID=UPI0027B5A1DA|nr:preprotein translocase subunit SecG [Marinimicrobium sp. ABcell2]MDQ2075772.1 preprotein translocase subunit SecG [Marinimicrobium sp. ABcell2]
MENIILLVHVLTALAIIGLILLQQGKGAVAGASFGGGASQTVFGSQGSGGFFTRATAVLAVLFFATSFGLAIIAKQDAGIGDRAIPTGFHATEIPITDDDVEDTEVPQVDTPDDDAAVPEVPEVPEASDVPEGTDQ